MTETEQIRRVRRVLNSAQRVVVFSGSGLSAESGIATFRDKGGIWERFPQEEFAEIPGLIRVLATQPDRLRRFLCEGIGDAARAEPNPAHRAIAEFAKRHQVTVVTQNIDGLHQAAGTAVVHELHGTLFGLQCTSCGRAEPILRASLRDLADRLAPPLPKIGARTRLIRLIRPLVKRCSLCHGRMRPAVVFFGEQLPPHAWQAAQEACIRCDAMLVVGTSA
jgi:NAD-dependent deacetylase